MFSKGLTESPNCECDIFKDQREKMNTAVADMWFSKRSAGNLSLSKEMLAGPNFSSKINSKDDKMVKLALFVYLQETKVI